ncbi:MAG: ABC transporter permease [Betaproteobacteria bacterium]|nr:MAG: ABC transporter permease [Betaproteobacteria bacterium]
MTGSEVERIQKGRTTFPLLRSLVSARVLRVSGAFLLLLVIWQFLHSFVINPFLLPSPGTVASTLWKLLESGELLSDIAASMRRILIGYFMGCFIGIVLGLLMGRFLWINDVLSAPLELIRPLSPVAMLPLVLIWFGIEEFAKYFLVAYTATIVVLINTVAGVTSMPVIRERAAACLGASHLQTFLHIVLPSAIPYIVTGMRAALGLSFMAIVAAELIAAESGVGYLIMQSRMLLQVDQIFAGLITLSILGLLSDLIFRVTLARLARRYQLEVFNV